MELRHVRGTLGHESLSTTSGYLYSSEGERHKETEENTKSHGDLKVRVLLTPSFMDGHTFPYRMRTIQKYHLNHYLYPDVIHQHQGNVLNAYSFWKGFSGMNSVYSKPAIFIDLEKGSLIVVPEKFEMVVHCNGLAKSM